MKYALFLLLPIISVIVRHTRAWWVGAAFMVAAAIAVIYFLIVDAPARGLWVFVATALATFIAIYGLTLRSARRREAERLPVATVIEKK